MSRSDYIVSNQVSPIILVGGVAGTGMLPIVSVLSSQNYDLGVLSSAGPDYFSQFFGQFRVLPGHTLMDNEVATYPLANQTVAANAIITQPLKVALEMLVPADENMTVSSKLARMTALKSLLDKHTAMGGYYNVSTPSYIYQGCLLVNLSDETDDDDGSQAQVRWVWQFMQPLLTEQAAQAAQNQAMSKISSQTQNAGNPPGSKPLVTNLSQPSSNIVQNVVPAATNPAGSNVAPTSTAVIPNLGSVSPITPAGVSGGGSGGGGF